MAEMNDNYNTQDSIDILFKNFAEFLKEKNKRYGDSVLNPQMIFSNAPAEVQISNRLDGHLWQHDTPMAAMCYKNSRINPGSRRR